MFGIYFQDIKIRTNLPLQFWYLSLGVWLGLEWMGHRTRIRRSIFAWLRHGVFPNFQLILSSPRYRTRRILELESKSFPLTVFIPSYRFTVIDVVRGRVKCVVDRRGHQVHPHITKPDSHTLILSVTVCAVFVPHLRALRWEVTPSKCSTQIFR